MYDEKAVAQKVAEERKASRLKGNISLRKIEVEEQHRGMKERMEMGE